MQRTLEERRLTTLMAALAVSSSALVAGCTAASDTGNSSSLGRDSFEVTFHLTFADKLFEASYPGEPHFFPFDEGHIVLEAITSPVPSEWAFSRTQIQVAPTQGQGTCGPYFLHPGIQLTVIKRVPLPAFLCAAVESAPAQLVVPSAIRPAAITACEPLPPEFATEGVDAKRYLPSDYVLREPVDLEFATMAPEGIVGKTLGQGSSWFENIGHEVQPDSVLPPY